MSDLNIAEKLWDLGNLVTGFGVVQSLATTYAVAKGELRGFEGTRLHLLAAAGTGDRAVVGGAGRDERGGLPVRPPATDPV